MAPTVTMKWREKPTEAENEEKYNEAKKREDKEENQLEFKAAAIFSTLILLDWNTQWNCGFKVEKESALDKNIIDKEKTFIFLSSIFSRNIWM